MKPTTDNNGKKDEEVPLLQGKDTNSAITVQTPATTSTEDKDKDNKEYAGRVCQQAVFEMFATFLFVVSIYLSQGDSRKFAFAFWVIITLFGKYSGAHLNPAVSFGFWVVTCSGETLLRMVTYWLFQLIGVILAVFACRNYINEAVFVNVPLETSSFRLLFCEGFFTGSLVFVILLQCNETTKSSRSGAINCAVIAAWLYFIINACSDVTGSSFNPAVLPVLNYFAGDKNPAAANRILEIVGVQFGGALVFAGFFAAFFRPYYESKFGINPVKE